MPSRDLAHVLDMLRAARLVEAFMAGVSDQSFLADVEKQSSVLYQLSVLGEAANRVTREFQSGHSNVDWSGIIGFRHRIVHGYDDVDLDIVLTIVREDLPKAAAALAAIAPENPRG